MEKLIGQATEEQIAKWKKEYKGGIYAIEVGDHIGYFRNPTRKDVNAATAQLDMDNLLDINESIMRDTQIGGSESLIADEALYLGSIKQISKKLEGAKAKLVNL